MCGFTYYLGNRNRWEGLKNNATRLDAKTAQDKARGLHKTDLTVEVKLFKR